MRNLMTASRFAQNTFALWVLVASFLAWLWPYGFTWIKPWIAPLLGVIMFGMGLTLRGKDFALVLRRPWPALAGVLLQFAIMPLAAYAVAVALNLPSGLAAGLVLVGACPGGTASNVIVYLSRGDVPLSVTMTSVSTLLAPLFTPFLLLWLAGSWLPVDPGAMVLSILQVVILPVVLGLVIRRFFPVTVEKATEALPLISVTTIVVIVAGVVALNAENFGKIALAAFLAVIVHNGLGLLLGYWGARVLRLDESRSRAVSIEVGMQNSGLGVTLALTHLNPAAALPGAIFSVWHNISGPLLATYWSRKNEKKAPVSESESGRI
ncbi:BASS family bile acid:Na+ symporter [Melghirimyces profundicolus]|uniref:BASS family bile acid:Na+ symporter n=1 Tax=Melghirimyces profundicolus TaxID=1242148 RepID=A0A2T6C4C1_9BACL|nr:bile acid:sodium symporter family protein [Melghirimyces profundicolus]PTX63179.1 BASS family bile acid:Na+ symporter [Melghirimyces profundicolus]